MSTVVEILKCDMALGLGFLLFIALGMLWATLAKDRSSDER